MLSGSKSDNGIAWIAAQPLLDIKYAHNILHVMTRSYLLLRAIPVIHEINTPREVFGQRVGKFLLKSIIVLWPTWLLLGVCIQRICGMFNYGKLNHCSYIALINVKHVLKVVSCSSTFLTNKDSILYFSQSDLGKSYGSLGWPPKLQPVFWNLDITSLKLYLWPPLWMSSSRLLNWCFDYHTQNKVPPS